MDFSMKVGGSQVDSIFNISILLYSRSPFQIFAQGSKLGEPLD
jgi:hypothetical protein